MASAAEQLASQINFSNFAKATELKKRIWFTLGALIVYRLGTWIPLPGIDPSILQDIFQQQSGGMLSGIGSTIAQGMAFGTGSAIAHRAVGAVAGSMSGGSDEAGAPIDHVNPVDQQQASAPAALQGPCAQDKQMFFECLQINKGDQEACRFLYDTLQTCTREQSSMNFS